MLIRKFLIKKKINFKQFTYFQKLLTEKNISPDVI